jgi:hypothetical protein
MGPAGGRHLLALDAAGDPRFAYAPSPEPPAGRAFGDVLEVSESGRIAVQALRFGGTISIAGERFTAPGVEDSAVVYFCLGGP